MSLLQTRPQEPIHQPTQMPATFDDLELPSPHGLELTTQDSQLNAILTLQPDGQATDCNSVEVGSIPTGVFDSPTAGLDYIC
jgi:hypothetical protein